MTIYMKAIDIRAKPTAKNTSDGNKFRRGVAELMATGYPLDIELHDESHLTFTVFESFEKWLDSLEAEAEHLVQLPIPRDSTGEGSTSEHVKTVRNLMRQGPDLLGPNGFSND